MNYLSVDYFILYAFLFITLIIGLRAGRGIKDIREYAIANRMFTTGALVITWLATDIAGETVLDMTGSVRKEGIIQGITVFGGWGIAMLMQALIFAPRFTQFGNCITMGDIMGQLYEGPSQLLTGVLGFFTVLCTAGMELTVLGILCETLFDIDYCWGVGIGGVVLVGYTGYGGIKAVTRTDILQFLILLVVVPIITVEALKQAGGIEQIFTQVPTTQFQVLTHPRASYYLVLFLSLSVFQFSVIDPALIQRMLMGRAKEQLRAQFFIIATFLFALMVTLLLLGLASIILCPNETNTPIVPHIVRNILPTGTKGLAAAGLLAITMSSFDSFLHAAGLTLVHDVVRPLYNRKNKAIDELLWTRIATVLIGFLAIIVGLMRADNLYGFVLISYKFAGPLLAFPLFAGVLGLKPDKYAFYVASGITIAVLLLSGVILPSDQDYLSPLISVIVNGIVFLGIHIVHNKGLAIVDHADEREYLLRPQRKNIWVQLNQLIPTPARIFNYSRQSVARYGAPYILLGVFCIANYIVPYFMWEYGSAQAYDLMLYLRFIGAIFCGLLVVKDKWPLTLLPYMPTFWHVTLLYCIPFTSTVMFLLTQGSVEWLVNVALTIMFLVVLVDWVTFIILSASGVVLGCLFYSLVVGPISLQLDFSAGYLLVYQSIFATIIGLIFARRRQQRVDKQHQTLVSRDEANQASLLQAAEERLKTLQTIQNIGPQNLLQVARELQKLPVEGEFVKQLHDIEASLIPMAFQLQGIDTKVQNHLRLQITTVPIKQWLIKVLEALRDKGVQPLRHRITTKHNEFTCDPDKLADLLAKGITLLQQQTPTNLDDEQSLLLGIEDTWISYKLDDVEEGYIRQEEALRIVITTQEHLPPLESIYWPDLASSPIAPAVNTQALSEQESKRIVKAHYGCLQLAKATLCYVIPVDIKAVRPKDMDKHHMELGAKPVRANDHYKSGQIDAQAQEKEFLKAVEVRSNADIGLIKTAIELIKWYHGPISRHSGEPFYLHPLAVATIVLDYNTEQDTILGALLHDTVEDTWMFLQHIETVFGQETAKVVDLVTHLQSTPNSIYKIKLSAEENLRMLERTGNVRALYVKLADRTHNIRTIAGHKDVKKRHAIANETLQFYVPVAERLGFPDKAKALQALCMQVIEK